MRDNDRVDVRVGKPATPEEHKNRMEEKTSDKGQDLESRHINITTLRPQRLLISLWERGLDVEIGQEQDRPRSDPPGLRQVPNR